MTTKPDHPSFPTGSIPIVTDPPDSWESRVGSPIPTSREALLDDATSANLKNTINEIYRAEGKVGDGSLMDAIIHQRATGELVGGRDHLRKGRERISNLENLLNKKPLNARDKEIARELIARIKDALDRKLS